MIQPRQFLVHSVLILTLGMTTSLLAGPYVGRDEAASVCRGWLETVVTVNGAWADDPQPLEDKNNFPGYVIPVRVSYIAA